MLASGVSDTQHIYIYVYIYIERERARHRYIHIYIYIYMHITVLQTLCNFRIGSCDTRARAVLGVGWGNLKLSS